MVVNGTGHRPDPAWYQPHHARVMLVQAGSPTPLGRPGEFVEVVRNQFQTSACEGFGWGAAIETCARAHGTPLPPVSVRALYAMARIREGQDPKRLTDDGTNGYSVASAIQHRGVVSEERCPFDALMVNNPLALDVWEAALDATLLGVGGLVGSDTDTLKACLDSGFPVTYAQRVDHAWDNYSGGVLGPYDSGNRGMHLTTLVDYDGDTFIGLNSWGTGWGRAYRTHSGGFYWISPERLAQATDFRAVRAGPARLT